MKIIELLTPTVDTDCHNHCTTVCTTRRTTTTSPHTADDDPLMADSVHCNHCLRRPASGDQSVKYFLTECENIYCDLCVKTRAQNCSRCPQPVCRTVELSNKMSGDIKCYFQDVTANNKRMIKVEKFQKKQRKRLVDALLARNNKVAEECNQFKLKNQNLENEAKSLKNKLTQMETDVANGRYSTGRPIAAPTSRSHSSLFSADATQSPMDGSGGSIVVDLFKRDTHKQTSHTYSSETMAQMDCNTSTPVNQTVDLANGSAMAYGADAGPRQSFAVSKVPKMANNVLSNPPLSPIQSLRKAKISVRNQPINPPKQSYPPLITNKVIQRHVYRNTPPVKTAPHSMSRVGGVERTRLGVGLNDFQLGPMPPMTVTRNRGYTTSLSSLSSHSNNQRMTVQSSPSTVHSSVRNHKPYNSRQY